MNNTPHLRIRGTAYHARMRIPDDVRAMFNGKPEFAITLDTHSKKVALSRLPFVIAKWVQQIHEARASLISNVGVQSPNEWAKQWLAELSKPSPEDDDPRLDAATTDLENQVNAGLMTLPEAQKAFRVATGSEVLFKSHSADFLDAMYKGKSRSSMSGALSHFLNHFETPEDITPIALRSWWQAEAKTFSANTIERVLSASKGFMRYLKDHDLVKSPAINLLKAEDLKTPRSAVKPVPYQPFTVLECIDLIGRAKLVKTGRDNLALLMQVGMYTGGRIEEVASIKREDIHLTDNWMMIRGTKTDASENREVPLHPDLKVILVAALASHNDNYMIPNLPMDKHGNRANAIGKQFGRLKAAAGFTTRSKCFHSYRKTFVTQMEQAGVSEGVVADIVGHEKKTITYGVYSGGSSMEQKRQAIAILAF